MAIKMSNTDGMVRVLTIDRPPVNALNEEEVDGLSRAVESALGDPGVRALVITGAGRVFVGGADLDRLASADKDTGREMVRGIKALHEMLRKGTKPVIAAINGMAAGGGLELAMACDIRIADEKARMGLPEVGLGVLPGAGGTQMLPRLVGLGKALEMMLSGNIITAQEALRLGLIEQIAPEGEVLNRALELAGKISRNAPLAVAAIKAAACETLSLPLEKGLEGETERFTRLCETEDKNEGIAAFKERRRPLFRGR